VSKTPELTTIAKEPRFFARILRVALRGGVARLALDRPPEGTGGHLLHVVLVGLQERAVWLLAQPVGPAENGLYPLRLEARSPVQAAQLYALAQLGGQTSSFPPTDEQPPSVRTHSQAPAFHGWGDARAPEEQTEPTMRSNTRGPLAPAPVPQDLTPPGDPLLGRILSGRYRVDRILGSGTAGAVYKGVHTELGREVAIKILHAINRTDPQFVKRLKAEARAASRLDHVNVTRVLDFGEEPDGLLFLVMEFVAGRTLEDVLVSEGALPLPRAVNIAVQVCSALVSAHAEGIVHRDIKPENVMLVPQLDDDDRPTDLVKVCDFGVAKLLTPDPEHGELTIGAGLIFGSPLYMSPEQARGERLDPRSDVYSLGVTLYEIATGTPPFVADSVEALIVKQATEVARPASAVKPGFDRGLDALLMRMLAKNPADRPPTARDVRAELREIKKRLS
jgi:eukaryotic-like serine/threonine-protein kinase